MTRGRLPAPSDRSTRVALVGAIAVPAVLAVVAAGLVVGYQQQHDRLGADARARAAAAVAVAQVESALAQHAAEAVTGAGTTGATIATDAVGIRVSPARAAQARDTGRPTLDDGATPPAVVAPIYRDGAPLTDTAARRRALTGYRVVPLNLDTAVSDGREGGVVVRGPSGIVAGAPRLPGDAHAFTVDLDLARAPGWTVQTWVPRPGPNRAGWWLLGILACFGTLAAAGVTLVRRWDLARRRQTEVERQHALVTGLAPVVQTSLDLGEVIPAMSAHLANSLSLRGLSLATDTAGARREMFSWGQTPDATVPPGPTPGRLDPGHTHALSLTRAGRTLGVMRIVAGVPLAHADLTALTTASELVTAALANAEVLAEQRRVVERLRGVDELKTVFLATASHELRTPVTAIVGFSKLLLDRGESLDSTQALMFLDRVHSNGRSLQSLIDQLLDFSRLERGAIPASDQLLDLGAEVGRLLGDRWELTTHHDVETDLAADCLMLGSAGALERIVTNLTGNAAKFSPSGTVIRVSVRPDGDRVALIVDDEGPGVAPADRERIFSRFYRGSGVTVTETRGAGVGLAIVAEYVASMSGVVTVAEAPTGGARFIVSFPAAHPQSDADREGAQHVPVA
jgi:signal transduction histidine kinase